MDFFGAQQRAKDHSKWAIALFVVAVLATILAVYAIFSTILGVGYSTMNMRYDPQELYITNVPIDFWICLGIVLAIDISFLLISATPKSSPDHPYQQNTPAWINILIAIGISAFTIHILARYTPTTPWLQVLFGDSWLCKDFWNLQRFFWISLITSNVILGACIIRHATVAAGSQSILKLMGARTANPNSNLNPQERILINIVEEMAIASGYPIPWIAIMPEESINAFAIGLDINDSAIVVTQGLLENLTREEIQAVIGHEFSHLLNADSRINIRIHSWLYGLQSLTTLGKGIFRTIRNASSNNRRNNKGSEVLIIFVFAFGVALIIAGSIGFFIGRIIQALISRQREFLADASSVQFTRNPEAMVKALGRIKEQSSVIWNSQASGFAHCFFANSSSFNALASLTSTHPPLDRRMEAINPHYSEIIRDLKPIRSHKQTHSQPLPTKQHTGRHTIEMATMVAAAGVLSQEEINASQKFKEEIPLTIKDALKTPEGSINLILAAALEDKDPNIRQGQLQKLSERLDASTSQQIEQLSQQISKQADEAFIPTAQLALARIARLDYSRRQDVSQILEDLIVFDEILTLKETFFVELVNFCLKIEPPTKDISANTAASAILSRLIDEQGLNNSNSAFATITQDLALQNISYTNDISTSYARECLPRLRNLSFIQRREFLIGASRAIQLDGKLEPIEAEYLRALAIIMQCPIPAQLLRASI